MFFSTTKHADSIFEDAMKLNPYYPFKRFESQDLKAPVYVFSLRYNQFYLSLLITGITGAFTLLWPIMGDNPEYCMFSALVLIMSGFYALEYHPIRTIIHDPSTKYFTVYRGTKIISCQPISDFFIRMVAKNVGSKGLKYHLVVDGIGIESQMNVSGETSNKKKLRSLAHKLANNLNVNYFDIQIISRHHVINQERTQSLPAEE